MPSLDIFNGDAFGTISLTGIINDQPHQPMRLGELGLFVEEGITTTTLMVERKGTTLSLVPVGVRGQVGGNSTNDKAKMIPISTVHLPQSDAMLADEVQNIRAFGSGTELEAVTTRLAAKLGKMRRNIDVTKEWHRIGAIKGQVLDADGTTVVMDMFTTFGVTQTTHAMGFSGAGVMQNSFVAAKRKMEAKLGGLMYTDVLILASPGWFDACVANASVRDSYDRWQNGDWKRADHRSAAGGGGFPFANTMIEEYRGRVGNQDFIADGEAYMIPIGVADMFQAKYAPADYMETVNTVGVPYYAKQERMKMDKGVELEGQSNPIFFNARPDAVVKLAV